MSKLVNGKIPANTTCPYSNKCGVLKEDACNGMGCPIANGNTTTVDFSCAAARMADMIFSKETNETTSTE